MPKMNPEYKAMWVAALRSGEYKQSTCSLQDENGFCCLGVMSDIVKDEICAEWNNFEYVWKDEKTNEWTNEMSELPSVVQELIRFPSSKYEQILINMNDSEDKTFSEIADYIEENL